MEGVQFIVAGVGWLWEGVVINLSKVSEEDVSCESDLATILVVEPK